MSNDVAVAIKITAETETSSSICGGSGGLTALRFHSQNGGGDAVEYTLVKETSQAGRDEPDWQVRFSDDTDGDTDESDSFGPTSGALLDTINQPHPNYFCMTRRSGILRLYISTNGTTYLPMVANEVSLDDTAEGLTLAQLVALDSSGVPTINPNYELDFDNSCANSSYSVTLDYMRFRSNFSGSASAS
ncbi:MAG: hypothetical protein Q7S68_00600, partial [Deltaproteobacteria bacterium]|nr:hypothetical protein [Deltaproteobacteria bacterium]